jgi:outer membrane protein assembly factor BamB
VCVDGPVDSGVRGIRDAAGVEGSIRSDARAESVDGTARPCRAGFIGAEVLTHHNDNSRTGANLLERTLDACTVPDLVQLAAFPVEGEIFAQPLFARDVATARGSTNLLVVATTASRVYGFDADDRSGAGPVWVQGESGELGTPAAASKNATGNHGILATPVIDRRTNTLYVLARDCDSGFPAEGSCAHRLFALDLRTGEVKRSVEITGSVMNKSGETVDFDPSSHWGRPALLLAGGRVYASFAYGPKGREHEEDLLYHGWIFGYSSEDFSAEPLVYCSTPNGRGGGIWQSGGGLAADESAIYAVTGNGIQIPVPKSPSGFPEAPLDQESSIVRIASDGTPMYSVSQYFDDRPYDEHGNVFQYLEKHDIDLGTSGPLLIPETRQLISMGKSGIVYSIERDTMVATRAPLSVFVTPPRSQGQSLYIYSYAGGPHVHGSPVFWKPDRATGAAEYGYVYAWPERDKLKSLRYDFSNGRLTEYKAATAPPLDTGGMLSLSADGGLRFTGILWASSIDLDARTTKGRLWAFDAESLETLWSTSIPYYAKFVPPTVVDGKVFVASSNHQPGSKRRLLVFGLP